MFPSRLVSVLGGGVGLQNNYSLAFDSSDDYINIGDLDLGTDDFTISMWAKSTEWSSRYLMYKKQGSGDTGKYWYCGATGGDAMIFASKMLTTNTISYEGNAGELTPYENQWVHLSFVADRDANIKGYINGVLQETRTGSNYENTLDNTGDLGIAWKGTAGGGVTGNLDEVALWNTALTAGDIATLYQARGTADLNDDGNSANLQGWWRMGDGTLDSFPLIADQVNPTLGSDVITSGGFEDGFSGGIGTGWSVSRGNPTEVTGNGGGSAQNLTNPAGNTGLMQDASVDVEDGKVYQLSFDAIATNGTGGWARSNQGDWSDIDIGSGSWTTYTTTFRTSDVTSRPIFYIDTHASSGTNGISIDNVSLKKVNGNPAVMVNMASDDIAEDTP